jgi:hypothetical protein
MKNVLGGKGSPIQIQGRFSSLALDDAGEKNRLESK